MHFERLFLLFTCIQILLIVFIQWQVYIKKNIITFAMSSFILACFLFILGIEKGENTLILISILTVIVRTFFIPRFMIVKLTKEHWRARESAPIMGTASGIICSILIVILFYVVYTFTLYNYLKIRAGALPLAMILQGLFLIISKRNTFVQLIGYMIMENGVLLFGAVLFPGLPFIFEAGIILDLLGIVMISAIINRLRENYVPDMLEDIEELKG
jgi:hydrogenase-4 component E